MTRMSLIGSKALLAFCNFLLLASGCTLVTGGLMILLDPGRVLLSRLLTSGSLTSLPHPLLYYISIGVISLGLILSIAGILGCWASCLHNYYLLTTYFLSIIILLVGECAIYSIAWAWPHCLGLGLDPVDLIKTLQRYYGVAGQEQFTAAIDLAQTSFNCCGVESANEYDTSLWRLQALGPALAVPLTCCKLENFKQLRAYLNPHPINSSLCQALELNRHESYRHTNGCRDSLEQWYKEHYIIFLIVGLVVVLVEFSVLLSTIYTCTKIYRHKQEMAKKIVEESEVKIPKPLESTYRGSPFAYNNDSYAMTNSFRQNYKLVDRI